MSRSARLTYVDWMRGLAVALMMQTHVYDCWLTPAAKATTFYRWSRLIGGYPAPLFLFLAGLASALAAEGRFARGADPRAVAREGLKRGLEILGYALLFRLFMLATSGFARPADVLRVDVLNCIGVSMMLVAAGALRFSSRRARLAATAALAAAVAVLTPLAWDAPWPALVPRPLLAYVSGRVADAFFPLFPWAAYVGAGAAVGILLAAAHETRREARLVATLAVAGAAAIPLALLLDRAPQVYPRYDFWWTSPNYVLIKVGILLLVLALAFTWRRLPHALPSPLVQMGRTSLLVYWVHVEIVYGGLVVPNVRHQLGVPAASAGLAVLALAMLLLSVLRTEGPRSRLRLAVRSTSPEAPPSS